MKFDLNEFETWFESQDVMVKKFIGKKFVKWVWKEALKVVSNRKNKI